jgi:copper chaperone NosL
MIRAVLLAAVLAFAGCDKPPAAPPPPQEVSAASTAQFCGMPLSEHAGPKGQIFVRDQTTPFWFASARDTIAFLRLPEMPKNIVAVYVNDMARAHNWEQPEVGTWIDARRAYYVIESRRRSGMDAEEAVPFGEADAARRFAEANGGRVVGFADIPDSYIFSGQGGGS